MALLCCGGHFAGTVWVHLSPLRKSIQSDPPYPVMKRFYPDVSGLFQDDNAKLLKHKQINE